MRKYAAYVQIYANFWICSIIFAHVILEIYYMQKNMRYASFGKMRDRIFAYN